MNNKNKIKLYFKIHGKYTLSKSKFLSKANVASGFGGSLLLSEQVQTQRAQYNKFGRETGSRTGF